MYRPVYGKIQDYVDECMSVIFGMAVACVIVDPLLAFYKRPDGLTTATHRLGLHQLQSAGPLVRVTLVCSLIIHIQFLFSNLSHLGTRFPPPCNMEIMLIDLSRVMCINMEFSL